VKQSGISFSAVCPIPNAGNPIVEALLRVIPRPHGFKVVPLAKETTNTGRRIVPMPLFPYLSGETVLLIDDLITKANTKLEAIEVLENVGCKISGLAVLIDREEGGYDELVSKGVFVIKAFDASDLFLYYHSKGWIPTEKYAECIRYMKPN
jgi:orotate phosphoribosyltransferase